MSHPKYNRRSLSSDIADLLQHGDREGRYTSRSEVVMAIALGCANAGWPRDAFLDAILDPQNKGGEALRSRKSGKPRRDGQREAERAWQKAAETVAASPPIADRSEVLTLVATYPRRADGWHWPRRWGQTSRNVLEAHFAIVERTGKLVHVASVREIAELAGVGIATVERAHRFLRREGWLRLHRGASRYTRDAAEWRLTAPTAATITAESLSRQSVPGGRTFLEHSGLAFRCEKDCTGNVRAVSRGDTESVPGTPTNQVQVPMTERVRGTSTPDLWRRGGLGPKAGAIYTALPRSVDDLSRLIGIRQRTVRRYLKLLKSHDLALKGEDAVWCQGPADLDVVAMKIGAAGLGAAQREEHERQRDRFDDLVERGGHRGRREGA